MSKKRNNPFHGAQNSDTKQELSEKELNWGVKKFVPTVAKAAVNNAWREFKTQMKDQSLESNQESTQLEAEQIHQMHKEREKNHRLFAMQQKKTEATTWDGDETPHASKNNGNGRKRDRFRKGEFNKTSSSNSNVNLSSVQSNTYRRAITKTVQLAKHSSLSANVTAMKKRMQLQELRNANSGVTQSSNPFHKKSPDNKQSKQWKTRRNNFNK